MISARKVGLASLGLDVAHRAGEISLALTG